jgi:hypothetical protein
LTGFNNIGQIRKKSANKSTRIEKRIIKEDEEMNKIMTALKFFKEHTNTTTNNSTGIVNNKNDKEHEKENHHDRERTGSAVKDSENRPRTSRTKRGSKNRRKSGNSSGGHSALGFHSNLQNYPLIHNIDTFKNPHNRSVNVAPESPRIARKRKINKDKVSPNAFAIHHQRQPSRINNNTNTNHTKNSSMDQEKNCILNKSRPRSVKLKKKPVKVERSKKNSINRIPNNSFVKGSMTAHGFMDSSILKENPSFDKDDQTLIRFMKKHSCNIKKTNEKLKMQNYNSKQSNKFSIYKNPSSKQNIPMPYDHMSYIEDLQKMHSNIEDLMKPKVNSKLDAKKRKAVSSKKKKHRRSATPQLVN